MEQLIVTDKPLEWKEVEKNVRVISPSEYINTEEYKKPSRLKVINLCRSYAYQSEGYYISLLAEARVHKSRPDVATIRDIKLHDLARQDAEDFDSIIQEELAKYSEMVEFNIYFGMTAEPYLSKIGQLLFNLYQMPILKSRFVKKDKWSLQSLRTLNVKDLEANEKDHLVQSLNLFLAGKKIVKRNYRRKLYDLAILVNPSDPYPASNARALKKFIKAAENVGFNTELITRADYGKITSFDALFIRETTNVNHHTFRFARKAEYEGLVVIDDYRSILKCTNKVYLHELLTSNKIPTPVSVTFRKNEQEKLRQLAYPYVLKLPDGAFSKGVKKVNNEEELHHWVREYFHKTDLLIAQEFMPSEFDWRVGVLNGQVLYVCKYYMAKDHWQIIEWRSSGATKEGDSEAIPVEKAPVKLLSLAVKAANLIGNGLYGVDIKERNGKYYVIEINDNPSIDAGVEDKANGSQVYQAIMKYMMDKVISVRK